MKYFISPENTPYSAHTYNLVVHLEKDFDDIGYYISTDGNILQEKNKCNFTYTLDGLNITIFNSVDKTSFVELAGLTYKILWGDGNSDDIGIEEEKTHSYALAGEYEITLKLETPWTDSIKKTITVGGNYSITNPLGTLTINVPYTDETFEQDYINLYDSECQDLEQDDIFVSGFTSSKLSELIKYGQTTITEGLDDDGNGVYVGGITSNYTAYTINNIFYTDFIDGLTYFHLNVGENPLQLICDLISKDEATIGVVNDIEVQSDVFLERGTVSVFEQNLRLCEIDSVGECEVYGNKYFKVKRTT